MKSNMTLKELVNTPAENPVRELRTAEMCGYTYKECNKLYREAKKYIKNNYPHLAVKDFGIELMGEIELSY